MTEWVKCWVCKCEDECDHQHTQRAYNRSTWIKQSPIPNRDPEGKTTKTGERRKAKGVAGRTQEKVSQGTDISDVLATWRHVSAMNFKWASDTQKIAAMSETTTFWGTLASVLEAIPAVN